MEKLNREAWLNRMAEMLRPWFRKSGYPIHGRMVVQLAALSRKTLGNCRMQRFDAENHMNYIFITAYEDREMADTVEVVGVLVHEILHAVIGTEKGHGKEFKEAMKLLDLTGKATSTGVGDNLRAHAIELLKHLPPLPRYGVKAPPPKIGGGGGNGMFRFQCPECKVSVFVKATALRKAGDPCCWNEECEMKGEMMEEQEISKSST